jgi:UPF0755 protein
MKKFLVVLTILIAIILSFSAYVYLCFNESISDQEIDIHIPQNTSINSAIEILNINELLQPYWLFAGMARYYSEYENKTLFAGYYLFYPGMTNTEILNSLFSGRNLNTVRVMIPEGSSIKRFADILDEKDVVDKVEFLRYCNSRSILDTFDIKTSSLEGYLMPDTYEFFKKQDPLEVLTILVEAQNKIWDRNFAKASSFAGKTRHEVLTLASIIEAESPVIDERKRISGVYHNRLRVGMLLQADPTIQYAVGEKRRLLYSDLNINSPYNTYKFTGLPPGPINCPSKSSIEAALFPEEHNYYYFVAVGDGSGRHNFSRNLDQHNVFKRSFRRNMRPNGR